MSLKSESVVKLVSAAMLLCSGPSFLHAASEAPPVVKPQDLEKLCDQGSNLAACFDAAAAFAKNGDEKKSDVMLAYVCKSGNAETCKTLASKSEGTGSYQQAAAWWRYECNSKESKGEGCARLAELAEGTASSKNNTANLWRKRACERGHQASCAKNFVKDGREGVPVPKTHKKS